MRLLYVCSDFGIPPDGTKGASIHLRAITRALAEQGHDVQLLSPRPGPGGDHPARRLLPAGCPAAEDVVPILAPWLTERELGAGVAQEIRSLLFGALTLTPAIDRLRQAPVDAVIERLSLLGHLGLDLSAQLRVPLIVEVNALLTEEAGRFRTLELQRLAAVMEQRTLQRADAVLTVSEILAARLTRLGVPRERVHVVPNGADVALFNEAPSRDEARRSLGYTDEFVIGFVGSLKPWHGVDVLLSAFKRLAPRLPDARLLIVGTGPMEQALRAEAQRCAPEGRVRFTGSVPHAQVPLMLRALDVAVAPFAPMEEFYFSPIKLFEYMAAGVCVVGSRSGQICEVIREDHNGLLFAPGDAADLADVLLRAHADPALRARTGVEGRRTIEETYTWVRAAQRTLRVVEDARQARSVGRTDPGRAAHAPRLAEVRT